MRGGVLVAVALCAFVLVAGSGGAANRAVRAGIYTGYGFDACSAPSTATLNAWTASPYRALGIYVGGVNRACKQPNLTTTWVQATLGSGWSLLPLYVGLQAPCVGQSGLQKISTNAATASSQGRAAAGDAAGKLAALGLPAGSPIYFDMEGYRQGDAACTQSVQAFVSAWDAETHARGYVPGVYGSAASTIRDVAALGSAKPDVIWIANWNGVESVFGDQYVSDSLWPNHQRVHQYKGGHKETYGGVTINIDSDYVDGAVVGGTNGPPPPPPPVTPPAGQVNSGDGLATVSWPAAAFATQVVVALTPAPQPQPETYAVRLTVSQSSDSAPVDGFGAPVTVHLLQPPGGRVAAFSTDGVTWQPLPKLPSAGLSESALSAYTVDPDGTIEIQTLVPGYFGLVADTAPPGQPTLTARLVKAGLYLSWSPVEDNSGSVASYTVLRNGAPYAMLAPTARRATVRTFASSGQTVFRLQAADAAGNLSKPSRPVVVRPLHRPAGLPRTIPNWAFALYGWQQHHAGARPAAAPRRPPSWYWRWAAWRALPYRLR